MQTYTALYEQRADAESAQRELQALGIIDADGISIADRTTSGFSEERYSTQEDKGIWASIKGAFLPDEDRHVYEEGVRRGGFLLTVNVDETAADQVYDILERSNAVDIDETEKTYRSSGFAPQAAAPLTGERAASTGDTSIPIVEERLVVGKRAVERGGVRVRSYVTETPVSEQVSLHEERVDVERRAVDLPLSAADGDLFRERSIEMTETAEEAVVGKDARVVEELVLSKTATDRTETIKDTVRKTEVDIERIEGDRTTRPLSDPR